MKQKVSDYIADYIAEWGIRDVFTVTGGGAMHMNDAFGHHPKLHCTYQHHEQACAMAAEAYARMDNRMAAVCVTTGPGATNAITGVLGGWMDSIPMLVFSGQARYATTVAASGLKLRSMGVQECNIVPVVTSITKYAQMIIHPEDIRYHLEKALYMAVNGRPGPVWLDIPLDVQGAVIDTEKLRGYDPQENPKEKPAEISQDIIQQIFYFIHLSHFQERYHLCIQHIIYFRPKLQLYINISKSICSTFQFLYLFPKLTINIIHFICLLYFCIIVLIDQFQTICDITVNLSKRILIHSLLKPFLCADISVTVNIYIIKKQK